MAKTQDTSTVEDAEFQDFDGAPLSLADLPEVEPVPDDVALMSILKDLGDDPDAGKVSVYKLQEGNFRKQMFLFDCSPSEFEVSMLQNPDFHDEANDKHMFRVILRNSKGIATAKTLTVMPKKKSAEVVPVFNPNDLLTPIASMISAMQENTNKLLVQLASQSQAPQKTTVEFLQEMQLMREVMGVNNQPSSDPLKVIELAKELAVLTNPEAADSTTAVLGKLADLAAPIFNAISQNKTAPQMIVRAPTSTPTPAANPAPLASTVVAPTPAASAAPIESNDDMNLIQQSQFKMALAYLITQAKRDGDPYVYAELVLDQGGNAVLDLITPPQWLENLAQYDHDVINYSEWFGQVRAHILEIVKESQENPLTDNETDVINDGNLTNDSNNSDTIKSNDGDITRDT